MQRGAPRPSLTGSPARRCIANDENAPAPRRLPVRPEKTEPHVSSRSRPHRLHRPRRAVPASRAGHRLRHRAGSRGRPLRHGPGGGRAGDGARGPRRHGLRRHLRERHRRPADRAHGRGRRPRRRGLRAGLHLPRDRGRGGAAGCRARLRGCRGGELPDGCGRPRGEGCPHGGGGEARAEGGDRGGPVRPGGGLRDARAARGGARDAADRRRGPELRRGERRPARRRARAGHHDQLLPGQAARLLRRRRRPLHRRRGARGPLALDPRARRGRRQVRHRPRRPQQPHGYAAGGDPAGEARRLRRRDRGARAGRGVVRFGAGRRRRAAGPAARPALDLGAVHDPAAAPRRGAGGARRAGRPDGGPLPGADAPAAGLPRRRFRPRLPAGQRTAEPAGSQPAHAPRPRRGHGRADRRRGAGCRARCGGRGPEGGPMADGGTPAVGRPGLRGRS